MPNLRAGLIGLGERRSGIPRQQAYVRVQWQPGPWTLAVEGVGSGNVFADDRGMARAAGHGLLHLEASRRWADVGGGLYGFVRLDNALDRAHVGSVIVNEANGRHFEPGVGRSLQLGLRWSWVRTQ